MSLSEDLGEIKIDDDVTAKIAAEAAQGADGVMLIGGFSFSEMLGRKDSDKGVKVDSEGGHCSITIEVKVEYGRQMYEVAHDLQKRVKDAVERMTGMIVHKINVVIKGIYHPQEVENKEKGKEKTKEKKAKS